MRKLLFWYVTMIAGACLAGCVHARSRARAGSLVVESPIAPAAAPATAARTVARSQLTLPAGSLVRVAPAPSTGTPDVPPAPLLVTLAAPAQLVAEVTRDEISTATGRAPPSPVELAKGFNLRLWGGAGLALAILALALALRGHMKGAAIAGAGAVVVPLIGHFVNSTAGLVLAGVCAAAAVAFFAAWHFLRRSGKLAPMT